MLRRCTITLLVYGSQERACAQCANPLAVLLLLVTWGGLWHLCEEAACSAAGWRAGACRRCLLAPPACLQRISLHRPSVHVHHAALVLHVTRLCHVAWSQGQQGGMQVWWV